MTDSSHESKKTPTVSGKWALAMIGVGTLLISGAVTAIAALSRDEGQLKASPLPPPVVSAPSAGSGTQGTR